MTEFGSLALVDDGVDISLPGVRRGAALGPHAHLSASCSSNMQ